MGIKEAKQNGKNVSVKYGNSIRTIDNSTLIGNTQNAVFVQASNRVITIYNEQNGNLVATSARIYLASNATAKVCNNTLEVKVGSACHIYDEKGKLIKSLC